MMRRGIHQVGASLKLIKASLTVPIECVIWCVFFFSFWSECFDLFGGVLVESRSMPARFIMSLWSVVVALPSERSGVPHAPFNVVGKFNVLVTP